ncbi:hypothetical protein ACULTK_004459 [Yersinia enterocolitica]|uniref:hypothetical protein n=1 Tax=Yersinia enterocolitica TaxID=630 RepID=UPI0021E96F22|nr:hypothetical protein [Yersinia enterocolitica]EKN3971071.1 hypothetical protein [Yersinia enterocolitica]UYK00425.1 hypothetical protein N4221_14545 [Yersinia enterocolitica]HDL8516375.1 hypothetical protein [Yersinia enterocolitica]HDL8556165.1 hypothetical protein [Yersinia enterocolitica]HDW8064933.1 hypothetical protein [Yersinia enterocolitica]
MKIKNIIFYSLLIVNSSAFADSKAVGNESILIQGALKEGYQAQRNLAFGYKSGKVVSTGATDTPKNEVKACAWRKILLIANPNKIDASDPINERADCRNLDFKEDENVWHIVHQYLPMIDQMKVKGKYMAKHDDEKVKSEDIEIIDIDG